MRWILPIALAALVFSPVQAQSVLAEAPIAQQTAGDFLKSCSKDSSRCGLAVGSALLDKIDVVSGPAQVCAPTGAQLGGPVSDWLRAHPAMASQPAEDAIFTALVALYPCGVAKTQLAAQ